MMKYLLLSLFSVLSLMPRAAENTQLPVESFASLRAFSQVKLSPNGSHLSFIRNVNGELVLTVYNRKTEEVNSLIRSDNHTIFFDWYEWANDEVLLIGARRIQRQFGGPKYSTTFMYAYNINDKGKVRPANEADFNRDKRQPQFGDQVISFLPSKKDKILVQGDFDFANAPGVYELDLYTLRKKKVQRSFNKVTDWIIDRQGNVRIALKMDEDEFEYILYDEDRDKRKTLFKYKAFSPDVVSVLGFDKDPNIIYYKALKDGYDALYKMNLTTMKKELVFSDDNSDFDGHIFYSPLTGEVAGFTHSQLDEGIHYWDEDLSNLYNGLRAVLPADKFDIDIIDTSKDQRQYVVLVTGEQIPGTYMLGNRDTNELTVFVSAFPDIDETVYSGKKKISYKARDGLTIEGYLTLPVGYKKGDKLPTIVFPHGGPMARDYADFDYWTALLAYNGYAVLQPNFRGSSGYGHEFEMAAVQGFGKEMQDDLQDAANWLVGEGIANKDKICIGGASYGGYAALMAVVKHPETFKCAASFAGVTDLERIVSKARYFTNKEIVRKQFGTDGDKLEKVSPVNFAKQINRPVLLVHGSDDNVVPVYHSREMEDELKDEGKDVTYIELEDGDHYLSHQPYRIKTLKAFLEFFDKNLKN
ncbi:S9 family peptidase [Pseudoalteromonas sp. S4389]|uniref:alpha/beta hydrolase family protein n=2 Tax=unclassified Pseudoalteromonas TaxID=194690 RepID=UPI0011089F21|nr:S9 family peptidase [Pseudoalteromonas sp. S4389]TMO40242.1 S9 family peptidase [Pseudoalteromonas sp. S4389]